MTQWLDVKYDDDSGEIINPEYLAADNDSMWWVDSVYSLHTVKSKNQIDANNFWPKRIARVLHPDEVVAIW
jgi:hypothetical protein